MIRADGALTGIAELATPRGTRALIGDRLGQLHVVHDAAVAWADGAIVFVGPRSDLAREVNVDGPVHDAEGGTVLPGFVDAHTHLPFAGWRENEFAERLAGATYSEIAARGGGILSSVRRTRQADLAELTGLCRDRLDEMLRGGTTTVEAKSGYGLERAAERRQLEAVRAAAADHPTTVVSTFLGAHTIPAEHRPDGRGVYLETLIEEILPEIVDRGLACYADAFVDANAFTVDEARRFLTAAAARGLKPRLHVDQLSDDQGAALAAELGAVSADHLEFVSPGGIAALARAGTIAVLLPAVSMFLRMDRYAPARALIDGGVPVALATDFNPGSCPLLSMGTVVWVACLQLGMRVDEAIAAATLNGAAALELAATHGSIEPGKRADLVVHRVPNRDHVVYRMGDHAVGPVFVGGNRV